MDSYEAFIIEEQTFMERMRHASNWPYLMITSKKEQRLYDEIERSLHGIEKREFPARPLEPTRCPTCPFFFICPA